MATYGLLVSVATGWYLEIGAGWLADELLELDGVRGTYDLITVLAVWHHLPDQQRHATFERLAGFAGLNTRLVLSLRLPPLSGSQGVLENASRAGWQVCDICRRSSLQPGNRNVGVKWAWCVFERVAPA